MIFGWTTFGEVGLGQVPDPTKQRQGAIVANVSTSPKMQATQETRPKINATVTTSPGK